MAMLTAKLIFAVGMAATLQAQTPPEGMAAHAQAAHDAEQKGDFATAVREYEYLARQLPRSGEMQSNLGVALYFDHQWESAIAVFHKAIALNAKLLAPHLFTGLAWYQIAKPDQAVAELEKAATLQPSDVLTNTWLGYAYVAQGRYPAAALAFEKVCALAPDNVDAWYSLGQADLEIGRQATWKLLTVAPNGGRAWQLAGEQFQLQGDQKKAREAFEQANARRPEIEELRTALVAAGIKPATTPIEEGASFREEDELYHQAHDAEARSRAAWEKVSVIAPDSYRAHQIIADAFAAEQQDDNAIAEYRTVLHLKPDLPGIHEAIGSSLLRMGKAGDALQEFQAELQLQPRSASVNTAVGQALLLTGKDEEAEKILQSALLMDRPPADIYRLLGQVELHAGHYQEAASHLAHYLTLEKDDATAYYLLSRAHRGLGDRAQMNQALSSYEKLSQDLRARNQAQGELERQRKLNRVDEEMVMKNDSTAPNPTHLQNQ
jgi:tetratricopeptide (TPR) repeat protein